MRKANKSILSMAVILIAGLNLFIPAFAQDPFTAIAVGGIGGASGAGLFGSMASMSGVDIGWSQSGSDPMDAMWNVLNPDHVYFSGEKHEATGQGEDIYDYIKVDIGDWLQAQSDFITEFCDTYNVTDNSSGNVTSPKSFNGIPFNGNNGDIITSVVYDGQDFTLSGGGIEYVYTEANHYERLFYNGVVYVSGTRQLSRGQTYNIRFMIVNYTEVRGCFCQGINVYCMTSSLGSADQTQNINWTSDAVNTSVFDGWDSAKVKIPNNISQLQTGWTLPDFLNELNRIWSGAGEDNIVIENGGDVPPVPVPDTPLGEVPFDDWIDLWGQGIYQQLENQSDTLDLIGSNGEDAIEDLESIDSNLDDLNQTAESIDTNIGIGNGILGGIRSLAQSTVDYLEGIAEHVGELVEEIVEGTETLISGILNQIPQAFGVIFGPIKQASSIWHYVVEWIQSIGAPFQFIWSMASGTSYYIILPVYASLAAAVVLAFYKRFGK